MAQRHFSGERDQTGKFHFWRADIAGLYAGHREGESASSGPIDLLDLSIAMADDRSRTDLAPYARGNPLPLAKDGYYFRALRFQDEPDGQRTPDHYAVCAFPSSPSAGMIMIIASDWSGLYQAPFYGQPPEFFPNEPEKAGWGRVED